jgi:hypothetical protein
MWGKMQLHPFGGAVQIPFFTREWVGESKTFWRAVAHETDRVSDDSHRRPGTAPAMRGHGTGCGRADGEAGRDIDQRAGAPRACPVRDDPCWRTSSHSAADSLAAERHSQRILTRNEPGEDPGSTTFKSYPACSSSRGSRIGLRRSSIRTSAGVHTYTLAIAILVLHFLGILECSQAQSSSSISSLSPTTGHAVGGYPVTVSGHGFSTDESRTYACSFSCNAGDGAPLTLTLSLDPSPSFRLALAHSRSLALLFSSVLHH